MIATMDKTNALLRQYGLQPKRKFGQNFLINPKTAKAIVDIATFNKDSVVIEIGPGLGALSELIAPKVHQLIGFEIDEALCSILKSEFSKHTNVEIEAIDFLKVDLEALLQRFKDKQIYVISNLPYYLTSSILIKLLTCNAPIRGILVMVQKEVANRISNNQGGKDFNELSIFSQLFAQVTYKMDVSKNDFFPHPNVDSAILELLPKTEENHSSLVLFVKTIFTQRRKTLLNNLMLRIPDRTHLSSILNELGLPLSARAEMLNLEKIKQLHFLLKDYF